MGLSSLSNANLGVSGLAVSITEPLSAWGTPRVVRSVHGPPEQAVGGTACGQTLRSVLTQIWRSTQAHLRPQIARSIDGVGVEAHGIGDSYPRHSIHVNSSDIDAAFGPTAFVDVFARGRADARSRARRRCGADAALGACQRMHRC